MNAHIVMDKLRQLCLLIHHQTHSLFALDPYRKLVRQIVFIYLFIYLFIYCFKKEKLCGLTYTF